MISQTALDHFRTSLSTKKDDPYSVLLRRNKLPMALLDDAANQNVRKVSSHHASSTQLNFVTYSGRISWRPNHSVKHSVPKLSENDQG